MMRSKAVMETTESIAMFRMNTSYQVDILKELGKGYFTAIDTNTYAMDIVGCFSEENLSSRVKEWCKIIASKYPNDTFSCCASVTNRLSGCSLYVDVNYQGKSLAFIERNGTLCLDERSPECVDCGCNLRKVINNRRFECPDCGVVYVTSEYIREEGSEEGGCHVFCFPKVSKVRIR